MRLFDGDAIVLAGATGRVGGATLATLVHEGARVLVVSRSAERAREAIEELLDDAERAAAIPFAADLTDPAQAEAAVAACVERYGRIDALVSLAGDGHVVKLVDSSLDDLRKNLVTFTETAFNLAIPALRAMLAQPPRDGARSRGRMVVVTAGSSKQPAPGRGLFGVAKAGVNVLMQAIGREHKADGIVANALVLGGVATEAARSYYSAEDLAAAATPQEVADALAFLASDHGSGVNGALVDLNAREVD
ncbi:MAG TPA: SDR family NAD(P)-dependent oxidoreductase [Candidatus Elarobacter sp.]|jgi:NAD(P)-dependent dehydrogenase (short-subunit alcohol dehydrogenase family)|nr:SDR family NAD(P)-dependent oxidoreductase [Candidatus Elarobacter sp.]